MMDVRDQMIEVIKRSGRFTIPGIADALIEHFDVLPKPPLTPKGLGLLARRAVLENMGTLESDSLAGEELFKQFEKEGLVLVRSKNEQRTEES